MIKNTIPASRQELKIIPLGGCEEVGRNMTVFEYGKDIIILDMGLQFPEEDMPGINYVIPNVDYLKGKEKNIRAVIFSHGHMDHIGAAPILLKTLYNPAVIGRPFTIDLIKYRMEDFAKGSSKKLKATYVKSIKEIHQFGAFTLKLFPVDHAIMDAMGVILETPVATIIHPGDWTIEHDPISKKHITYNHLAKLKKPTVLMLESLGSINSKKPVSEVEMMANLELLIKEAPARIIIATFSSQVERIKQIINIATKTNKKVALDGFSMKMTMELAKELGYVKLDKNTMITVDKINDYKNNKVIALVTGAQGEENAALSRIANGDHRSIKIKKSDTIVFSSSVIPGNERTVQRLRDKLYRLSDHVIHSDIMDIHISGHSNKHDMAEIIKQIKPTFFIPVYANHFFLKEAAKIAYQLGYKEDSVIVPDNGSIISVSKTGISKLDNKVNVADVYVDGSGVGDVGEIVLRDRQKLSDEGMFIIVAAVDKKTGEVKNSPDIISRGFIYLRESKDLLAQTRKKVVKIINDAHDNGPVNWINVKETIRKKIGQFLFSKTERNPIILVVLIEV